MDNLPSDAPQARHCHIAKRPDFQGYGFNLHAEKARPGQFIGKVDPESPAEVAGLFEGDRIIEVNGVNISQENHKQVVQRIKAISNETRLLVVEKSTDDYYKKLGIMIRSSMANVLEKSSVTGISSVTTGPSSEGLKIWGGLGGSPSSLTTSEVNGNLDNEAINVALNDNDTNHQVIQEEQNSVEVETASPRSSKSSTASMEKVRQV